jgi:hypothetical protein
VAGEEGGHVPGQVDEQPQRPVGILNNLLADVGDQFRRGVEQPGQIEHGDGDLGGQPTQQRRVAWMNCPENTATGCHSERV